MQIKFSSKILMILLSVLLISFDHAYAQNQNMSTDAWIISIGGSFIGGSLGALILVEIIDFARNRRITNRISDQLNSDFSMIKRIIETQERSYVKINEQINNQNYSFVYSQSKDKIIDYLSNTNLILSFVFWDIVFQSNSLLKFGSNEIKAIKISHDRIVEVHKLQHEKWQRLGEHLANLLNNETDLNRAHLFLQYSNEHIEGLLDTCATIKYWLNHANDNTQWMNLNSEIALEPTLTQKDLDIFMKDKPNIQLVNGKLVLVDDHGAYIHLE